MNDEENTQQPGHASWKSTKVLAIIIGVAVAAVCLIAWLVLAGGNSQTAKQAHADDTAREAAAKAAKLDVQYKIDATKLAGAINNYSANNRGQIPLTSEVNGLFLDNYLEGAFISPDTQSQYTVVDVSPIAGEIEYQASAMCDTDNSIITGTSRQSAIRIILTNGKYYCVSV